MLRCKSIKTRLLRAFGLMLIVATTSIGQVGVSVASKTVIQTETNNLRNLAAKQSALVQTEVMRQHGIIAAIARNELFYTEDIPLSERQAFATREINGRGFSGLIYVDLLGNTIFKTVNVTIPKEFINAVCEGKQQIVGPLKTKDNYLLGVAEAVKDSTGNRVGVIIGTQTLEEFTQSIRSGEGKFMLLNENGDTIAHSDKEQLLAQVNLMTDSQSANQYGDMVEIYRAMLNGESGLVRYVNPNNNRASYLAYEPIGHWSVAYIEQEDIIEANTNKMKRSMIFMNIELFIAGCIGILLVSKRLAKGIEGVSQQLDVLASGDYSQETPQELLAGKDEIGNAARALDTLKQSMRQMIGNIQDNTVHMNQENSKIVEIANGVLESSQGISLATEQVAEGVASQSGDLVSISQLMEQFGKEVDSIVTAIGEVDHKAGDIGDIVEEGNGTMTLLIQSINNMQEIFTAYKEKIYTLNGNISQITDITNVINGIAEQTNLLALNASIEAARAGEAGKGFSVVAEEIRKLAEQSKKSAASIDEVIKGVSNESAQMLADTEGLSKGLLSQVSTMNESVEKYKSIIININEVTQHINEINEATSQIIADKNDISEKIEAATAVAQEVAASTEEISASAEEAKQSVEQLNKGTKVLNGLADDLNVAVNQFKL